MTDTIKEWRVGWRRADGRLQGDPRVLTWANARASLVKAMNAEGACTNHYLDLVNAKFGEAFHTEHEGWSMWIEPSQGYQYDHSDCAAKVIVLAVEDAPQSIQRLLAEAGEVRPNSALGGMICELGRWPTEEEMKDRCLQEGVDPQVEYEALKAKLGRMPTVAEIIASAHDKAEELNLMDEREALGAPNDVEGLEAHARRHGDADAFAEYVKASLAAHPGAHPGETEANRLMGGGFDVRTAFIQWVREHGRLPTVAEAQTMARDWAIQSDHAIN